MTPKCTKVWAPMGWMPETWWELIKAYGDFHIFCSLCPPKCPDNHFHQWLFFFFFFFPFSSACTPYGSSWARDWIQTRAATYTPQLQRLGIQPGPSQRQAGSSTHCTTARTHLVISFDQVLINSLLEISFAIFCASSSLLELRKPHFLGLISHTSNKF